MSRCYHTPVLCSEFLEFFKDLEIKTFVDGTVGAGGHAEALLMAHPEIETFIAMDQDESALSIATERLHPFKEKVTFVQANFCQMADELKERGFLEVDGIFMDIGVSSMQIDQAERGFSFSKEGPLDMRMDRECTLTAEEVLTTWSEAELGEIFREYGDLPNWRKLAKAIVEGRRKQPLKTIADLKKILSHSLVASKRSLPPLTLIFQALRIAVNNELEVLSSVIPTAVDYLSKGGRLGIISFHSGEDRIVKNCFRQLSTKSKVTVPKAEILTKKPVVPSREEGKKNSRSRSAKMRFLERN
ncbi:MAG: Ribosomal RNA small subunit methyltransferase H [Chlamydiae bacterium]|nr:Ribosomal RNA small subunit methyltransferase H [Chlamydiota bacterium]